MSCRVLSFVGALFMALALTTNVRGAEDKLTTTVPVTDPKATTTVPTAEAKVPTRESHSADVVYVPTPHDVVTRMLKLANVTKADVVYDLGCGDGRIVVMAAKRYGAKGIGYDIDPQRIKECKENAQRNKVEELVQFKQEDIFKLDLSKASVVTLYLLPTLNVKLIPQLEKLKDGSRIVSHDFDMKGVKPDKVVTYTSKEDNTHHTLYLWTTPLKKEAADSKQGAEP